MEKQERGALTERIICKSRELMGREITRSELRLMPYVQYCVMNSQNLSPEKMNIEERGILRKWRDADLMSGGITELSVTKKFWDIMGELIYLGYVDLK